MSEDRNATTLRVAFLGNPAWAVPCLERLSSSAHPVVWVGTRPPRPGRRGGPPSLTPVAEAAERLGLACHLSESVTDPAALSSLRESRPDILVVVAYGELLRSDILEIAPRGAINVHFSWLPLYRGAAPVQHALLDGRDETGVSVMQLDAGMDSGPVFARQQVPIEPGDDARSLGRRLAEVGGGLLLETLSAIGDGSAKAEAQDAAAASFAPKPGSAEREINWQETTARCLGKVRAFSPTPGVTMRAAGAVVKVLRAEAAPGTGEPGSILDPAAMTVATGDGAISLLEVAPAGRKRMSGRAYARGARFVEGEPLDPG